MDVGRFDTTTNTDNKPYHIQQERNTSKRKFHHGLGAFCELEIKFKDKVQLMIIDVYHMIYQLGLSKRINNVLVDIKADDIHR